MIGPVFPTAIWMARRAPVPPGSGGVRSRSFGRAKIQAVIQKLEAGLWDQVWWIDADAVFLDGRKRLDGFLHPSRTAVFPGSVMEGRVMASTGVWGGTPRQLPGLRDV